MDSLDRARRALRAVYDDARSAWPSIVSESRVRAFIFRPARDAARRPGDRPCRRRGNRARFHRRRAPAGVRRRGDPHVGSRLQRRHHRGDAWLRLPSLPAARCLRPQSAITWATSSPGRVFAFRVHRQEQPRGAGRAQSPGRCDECCDLRRDRPPRKRTCALPSARSSISMSRRCRASSRWWNPPGRTGVVHPDVDPASRKPTFSPSEPC